MTLPIEYLKWIKEREGGYVNDPDDPGGATNMGITQVTYDLYRKGKNKTPLPVKGISDEEVLEIYDVRYWRLAGEGLTPPLDLVIFDTAVNMGVGFANELKEVTTDPAVYLSCREAIYRWITKSPVSKMRKFRKGWLKRVQLLRKHIGL